MMISMLVILLESSPHCHISENNHSDIVQKEEKRNWLDQCCGRTFYYQYAEDQGFNESGGLVSALYITILFSRKLSFPLLLTGW